MPGPPSGYVVDKPAGPPAGYTVDSPDSGTSAAPAHSSQGFWQSVLPDAVTKGWDTLTGSEATGSRPGVLGNIETGAHNILGRVISTAAAPVLHPIDTLQGMAEMTPPGQVVDTLLGRKNPIEQRGQEFQNEYATDPALAIENLAGDALGTYVSGKVGGVVGDVAGKVAEPVGKALRRTGGKILDNKVGLVARDTARGNVPGEAYYEGGGGPALTLKGLSEQAANVSDKAGQALSNMYQNSTAGIDPMSVVDTVQQPINELRTLQENEGGTGADPSLDQYDRRAVFPLAQAINADHEVTPSFLHDYKMNIAKNTRWNDPTKFDLNTVRQRNVGALGDLLTEAVPESADQNRIYRGAKVLSERAKARSESGQMSLGNLKNKAIEAAVGGVAGHALSGGMGLIPAIGLPMLDSLPVRSTLGYGFHRLGTGLPYAVNPEFGVGAGSAGALGRIEDEDDKSNKR